MSAGNLRERVTFQVRGETAGDGYGNNASGWVAVDGANQIGANIKPMRGTEDVLALRLTGQNMFEIKVRYHAAISGLKSNARIVDERNNEIYSIVANPENRDQRKRYLWFTCKTELADVA